MITKVEQQFLVSATYICEAYEAWVANPRTLTAKKYHVRKSVLGFLLDPK
jgi:hypothetical protein